MSWTAAMLALALGAAQSAPPTGSAEEPTEVEGVVVEGRRLSPEERRKAESAFVKGLSTATKRNRLARWNREVCPGVVGLPEAKAAFIAERIAAEARALKLEVGRSGCRPDILILFTSRPDQAAADFAEKYSAFLADQPRAGEFESGGGRQGLNDFLRTPRPVRWWHVAQLTASDDRPLSRIEIPPGSGNFRLANQTTGGSRLASLWKEDLTRAVIIVDATKVRGVTYEALASYLAMVSLAQLDPDPDPGALSSIMTLFADREAGRETPASLSGSDRAFLQGLYAAPADAAGLNVQRGAIRRSLADERE